MMRGSPSAGIQTCLKTGRHGAVLIFITIRYYARSEKIDWKVKFL